MGVFNHWPYTNLHELNLDFIIQEIRKIMAENKTLSEAVTELKKQLNKLEPIIKATTIEQLDKWLEDGTLQQMVDNVLKHLYMTEDYTSIITADIEHYDYDRYMNEIEVFRAKYPGILTIRTLGNSYLGRAIPLVILGNPSGSAKALIVGQQHAREIHCTQLIMKQIEYYAENWYNEYSGDTLENIFQDAAIYFVPMTNPDGNMLVVHGLSSIPTTIPDYNNLINNIKSALEQKIRTDIVKNSDVAATWDLYQDIEWITPDVGRIANYGFREQDLYMWKANLQGIDLHYNCWEEGVNFGAYQDGIQSGRFTQGEFALQNEIGLTGWDAAENVILKTLIDAENLYQYTLSYHGRIPLIQWNYDLHDKLLNRVHACAKDFAIASQTRYSDITYPRLGFAGYFFGYAYARRTGEARNRTISMTLETGWSKFPPINVNSGDYLPEAPVMPCPLANAQEPYIWKAWKEITLLFLYKYVRFHDMTDKYDALLGYNSVPQNLTGIVGSLNSSGEIDTTISAGAYEVRDIVQQRIYNRVFLDGNIKITNKGTLADQTTTLIVRANGLISAKNEIGVYTGTVNRITGYNCPLGDKSNLIITPEIIAGGQYIRFTVNNPETGAVMPIRPKDITNGFGINFSITYIGANA